MKTWKKLLIIAALKYPAFALLLEFANRANTKPWTNDFAYWCHWDCMFLTQLAEGYGPEKSTTFPVWVLAIRWLFLVAKKLGLAIGIHSSAILLSNVFSVVALLLVWRLGECLWGKESREAWVLPVLMGLFPYSHFWSHGFSEPFFLTLTIASILALFNTQWWAAAACIGIAAVTRPQGIWLLSAFSVLVLVIRSLQALKKAGIIGLAILPFFLFLVWEWKGTGNAFYFMSAQKTWGRSLSIWDAFKNHIPRLTFDYLALCFGYYAAACLVFARSRLGFKGLSTQKPILSFIGIETAMLAGLPLFVGGYYSYSRFISTNVGVFIVLTPLVSKRPILFLMAIIWCLVGLATQLHHWSLGLWCG